MMIQKRAEGDRRASARESGENSNLTASPAGNRLSVYYEKSESGKNVARNRNRYVFDYNVLESSLLVCGVFLLLAGLVFNSAKFEEGTAEYKALIWIVILVVAGSTLYCLSAVFNEMRRSWKYSISMHKIRKIEANLKALARSHPVPNSPGHAGLDELDAKADARRQLRSGSVRKAMDDLSRRIGKRHERTTSKIGSRIKGRMTAAKKSFRRLTSVSRGNKEMVLGNQTAEAVVALSCAADDDGGGESKVLQPSINEIGVENPGTDFKIDTFRQMRTNSMGSVASDTYYTSRSAANSVANTKSEVDDPKARRLDLPLKQLADGLPPKWAVSEHDGNPYYYHVDTCEVSWTRPRGAHLPVGYSEVVDTVSGRTYYVVDTGDEPIRTTWALPPSTHPVWAHETAGGAQNEASGITDQRLKIET
jgi:hypothetical protein